MARLHSRFLLKFLFFIILFLWSCQHLSFPQRSRKRKPLCTFRHDVILLRHVFQDSCHRASPSVGRQASMYRDGIKDFYTTLGGGRCLRPCLCCALNLETVVRGFKYNAPVIGHQWQAFNHADEFRVMTPKTLGYLWFSQIIKPGVISMSPQRPCTSSTPAPEASANLFNR